MLQAVFSNETLRIALFRARFVILLALLVPAARFMSPDRLLAAVAVSLFGQLIQTWCFASLVKNDELTQRGPYRMCRNPMYLGRYFLILGFILLFDSWIAVALYSLGYYAYMYYRVRREEVGLENFFGDSYRAYCREVNRFFPSLRPLARRSTWFFDRAMFLRNNAHWNIVLTAATYVALYWIHRAWFA